MIDTTDVFTGVDYVHGTFVLVDTDPTQFEYESYEEFCEDNDIEPQGEDSDDFYEWCSEEADNNYESDMDNIKCHKEYNVPVTISGKLGLWDGKHEIVPVEMDSVYDAIVKCYSRDIDRLKVTYEDGVIVVYATHHDGTNIFQIKPTNGQRFNYLYA